MTRALGESTLDVFLDVRWPQSYLALGPLAAMRERSGIETALWPIAVPPLNAPSPPAADDDRGTRHRRARSLAIAREIETYASAQGLVVREWYRAPDTTGLQSAWLWLAEAAPDRLDAFLDRAFRAYWAVALDPADERAIADLLVETGEPAGAWSAWHASEGRAAVEAHGRSAAEAGAGGTPAFRIEDEYFQGRQHLPMIEWIAGGRKGRGPI